MSGRLTDEQLRELLHDLRSPLNVVLGYACLLEVELEGEPLESATEIRRAAERLVELLDAAASSADTPSPERRPSASDPTRSDAARGEGWAQVLLIEDQPSNVRLVERILRHRPHLELEVLGDGPSVRARVGGPVPQLVLCDRHLPGADGLDLVAELADAWPDTAVCLVTADASASVERVALERGADRVLTKPFSVGELLALADAVVPAGGGADSEPETQRPGSSR